MNAVRKSMAAFGFIGLLAMMICPHSTSAADDCPKAEEIVQRHADWKSAFTGIRMVFEIRYPWQLIQWQKLNSPSVDKNAVYNHIEWIHNDDGWYRHTTKLYVSEKLMRMRIIGDDGRNFFLAEFTNPSIESQTPSELSLGTSRIAQARSAHPGISLEPLELIRVGTWWLDQRDREFPPVVLRCEKHSGRHCAVIKQPEDSNELVWLDLDHDALPFRVASEARTNVPRFRVNEYLQMENGHWFPKTGTSLRATDKDDEGCIWNVQEVSVNENYPQSQFEPPQVGAGTFLHMLPDNESESRPELAEDEHLIQNRTQDVPVRNQWNQSRDRIIVATFAALFLLVVSWMSASKSRQ